MDNHGKKTSVVIEQQVWPDYIFVYADEDTEVIIAKVAGVRQCKRQNKDTFAVWLDPRYDFEFVKAEIVAAIKIVKE